MRIAGAASAFPPHYYSQNFLTTALAEYWGSQIPNIDVLRRLHTNAGVDGRHLALPVEEYYRLTTFGEYNEAWKKSADELGTKALCRAMTQGGIHPKQIGALLFVSGSGISSPSVDVRLSRNLQLSPSTRRIPIFGLGCV